MNSRSNFSIFVAQFLTPQKQFKNRFRSRDIKITVFPLSCDQNNSREHSLSSYQLIIYALLQCQLFSTIDQADSTKTSRTSFIRIFEFYRGLGNFSDSILNKIIYINVLRNKKIKDLLLEINQSTASNLRVRHSKFNGIS